MPLDISAALYDYHTNTTQAGEGPEIYQGALFLRQYVVQNADGTLSDLTGYTITCEFDDDGCKW